MPWDVVTLATTTGALTLRDIWKPAGTPDRVSWSMEMIRGAGFWSVGWW